MALQRLAEPSFSMRLNAMSTVHIARTTASRPGYFSVSMLKLGRSQPEGYGCWAHQGPLSFLSWIFWWYSGVFETPNPAQMEQWPKIPCCPFRGEYGHVDVLIYRGMTFMSSVHGVAPGIGIIDDFTGARN